MAYVWLEVDGGWAAARLEAGGYRLEAGAEPRIRRHAGIEAGPCEAELLGSLVPTGLERWVLVCGKSAVRVNGEPVVLGMRVLKDRDEVRLPDGARLYFSAERLAEVAAMPAGSRPVSCARCHRPIEPGNAAVQCPGCNTWHHQTDELPCWLYDERCALCPQATALDASLNWSPERL